MPAGKAPNPGPKTPEKYGNKVGPKYQQYGELEYAGWVYDPAKDDYYYDPKAQAKWEQAAKEEVYGAEPKPPGIWEQAAASTLPTFATVGGLYGMNQMLTPDKVETLAKPLMMLQNGNVLLADGKIVNGATGAIVAPDVANSAAATTSMPTAGGGTSNGLLGIGGGGNLLSGADKTSALEGLFSGGTAAPVEGGSLIGPGTGGLLGSGDGLLGIGETGTFGQVALPLAGASILGDTLMNDRGKTSNTLRGGLAGGLGALPFYAALGPWGLGAAVLGGGLLGLGGGGLLGHKSTKEVQAERSQALTDRGVTGYADFQAQIDRNAPGYGKATDPAGWKPEDVWGSQGVFDTFGDDWLGAYSEDDRRRISQRLLDEGLLRPDKGDVIIHSDDQPRAKQIAEEERRKDEEEEARRGSGAAPLDNPIV